MWEGEDSGAGLSWQVGWHETSRFSKASERLLVWEHLSDLVGVPIPPQDQVGTLRKSE